MPNSTNCPNWQSVQSPVCTLVLIVKTCDHGICCPNEYQDVFPDRHHAYPKLFGHATRFTFAQNAQNECSLPKVPVLF